MEMIRMGFRRIVMVTAHYIGEMETDDDALTIGHEIISKQLPKHIEVYGKQYTLCYDNVNWKPKSSEWYEHDEYYIGVNTNEKM
jgi:hypothetical protein